MMSRGRRQDTTMTNYFVSVWVELCAGRIVCVWVELSVCDLQNQNGDRRPS